jgi:hypothetical protein
MKTVQTSIFGEVQAPDSFLELVSLTRTPLSSDDARIVRMWRGQSNIDWRIDSGSYRKIRLTNPNPKESEVRFYEKRLLERATHRGFRHIDGRQLSDFELLARLQHHGAATRLLDTSRSALVALFFAVSANAETTGALFGFHSDYLGGHEETLNDDSYNDIVGMIEEFDHPQTWQPPIVSHRISAQHSQFLYSKITDGETSSLAIPQKSLQIIAISPDLKKESQKILSETFDIRYATLFPDIDGFGFDNSTAFDRWASDRW